MKTTQIGLSCPELDVECVIDVQSFETADEAVTSGIVKADSDVIALANKDLNVKRQAAGRAAIRKAVKDGNLDGSEPASVLEFAQAYMGGYTYQERGTGPSKSKYSDDEARDAGIDPNDERVIAFLASKGLKPA